MSVGLVLGAFDLINTYGDDYSVETLAEGTDWGKPEPIEVVIRSLMQDGSIAYTQGFDIRTVNVVVVITAADAEALAQGEDDLFAELGRGNTLTYTPHGGFGAVTVFNVLTSSLEPLPDDLAEVRGERYYRVRLVCEPFGCSASTVTLTPTPTNLGTARQRFYTFAVPGSARTEAALTIADGTNALGDVLAYLFDDDGRGYRPGLRQYATTGTTSAATSDATLVSGKRNMLDTAAVFEVPASTYYSGLHAVIARCRVNTGGTVNVRCKVETLVGGTVLATDYVSSATVSNIAVSPQVFGSNLGWQNRLLGAISLPTVDVGDQANATIRWTIDDIDTSGVDMDIDEVWALNTRVGALLRVDCGTGTAASGGPSKRLFSLPPATAADVPRLLRGHASDMSDAFFPATVDAQDRLVVQGGGNASLLVVTSNATGAAATIETLPRWYTHARTI